MLAEAEPPRWPSGKAFASRAEETRIDPFFVSRVIPVIQNCVVAILPGAWRLMVSAVTSWISVSIL